MKKRTAKTAHKNRSALLAYGLLTLVVVGIAIGGISAKYFRELGEETGIVTARDFYFESDLLSTLNPEYTLAAGTETVTFKLRNYADEKRWADDDIAYTVTVTDDDAEHDAAISNSSGTIATNGKNDVEITLSNLQDGKTYVVTATGSAGYVETLAATFSVATAGKVYKHLATNGVQVILTIWTENVTGEAAFTIPEDLIPNVTETPELETVRNYNGGEYESVSFKDKTSFSSKTYSSQAYYFIKDDPEKTYTLSQFGEIQVGGVTAIAGTP